jgi:AraC-like DNA-binding protein
METFSEAAMRELDDEALGWFSRRLPWGSYGMLCRASLTAPDLGVALKRWCRHHRLLVDDVVLELHVSSDRADLVIEERQPIDRRLREFCMLTLLRYVHGYACWVVDSRIQLRGVTFAHPPPPHARAYDLMFPGPVTFDASVCGMSFDAKYLALPLRRDETALRAMLERALPLTVLQYRRDRLLVQLVRELLRTRRTADDVARELNMSARTLHRQLKDEGTSLQALKDQVRRDLATDMLLRTDRPVKQIALAAAFRSEKSFTRAFRQWTGHSPVEYRRKLATGGRG